MGFKELTSIYIGNKLLFPLQIQHSIESGETTVDGKALKERKTLVVDGSALVFSLQQENEDDVAKYLSSVTAHSSSESKSTPTSSATVSQSSSSVTSQAFSSSSSTISSSQPASHTNPPYVFPIDPMKLFHYPQVKQDKSTLSEICNMFKIAINNYIWPSTDRLSSSKELSVDGFSKIPESIVRLFRDGKIDSYVIQTLFSKFGHNMPSIPDIIFPHEGKERTLSRTAEFKPLSRQEVQYTITTTKKHIVTRVPDCLSPGDFLAFRNKVRTFLGAFDKCGINLLIILDGVNDPSKINTHMERADKNANRIEEWLYDQKDIQEGETREYKGSNQKMPIPRYCRYVLIEEANNFPHHQVRVADGEADPELMLALRSVGSNALGIWSSDSDYFVPRNGNPFFTVQGTAFDFKLSNELQHLLNDGVPRNWNCFTDQDINFLLDKSTISINLQYVKTDDLMRSLGLIPTKTEWENLRRCTAKDIFPRYFSNFEASSDLWSRLEQDWVWPIFAISLGNDYLDRPDIDPYFDENNYPSSEASSPNRCIRFNYRVRQIRKIIHHLQRVYQNYKSRDLQRSLPKLEYDANTHKLNTKSTQEVSHFLKFLNQHSLKTTQQTKKKPEKRFAVKSFLRLKYQFYPPANREYSSWSKLLDSDRLPYINLLSQIIGGKQYYRAGYQNVVEGESHYNLLFDPKPQWEHYKIKSIEEKESAVCSNNIFNTLEDTASFNKYLDKYLGESSNEDIFIRCILYTYKELMRWAKTTKASDKFIDASIEIPVRALVLQYLLLNKRRCEGTSKSDIKDTGRCEGTSKSEVKFPSVSDSKHNRIFIPSSIWTTFLFVTTYMRVKWLSEIYQALKTRDNEQNSSLKCISNVFDAPTFYECYLMIQDQKFRWKNDDFLTWIARNYHE